MNTKKSGSVPLVIVPAIAAAAIAMGCGSGTPQGPAQRVCIDNARTVVDQQRCLDEEQRGRGASGSFATGTGDSGGSTGSGGGVYVPMHHWYYYPYGSRLPILGSIAPSTGTSVAPGVVGGGSSPTSSGVVRGGFGSTSSGSIGA